MESQGGIPFSDNFDGKGLNLLEESPSTGKLLMELDPWISPYSAKIRESIFQGLVDQAKRIAVSSQAPGTSTNHTSDIPANGFPTKNLPEILSTTRETQNSPPIQLPFISPSIFSNQVGALDDSSMNQLKKQDPNPKGRYGNWNTISLPVNESLFTTPTSASTTPTTAQAKGLNLDGLGWHQVQTELEKFQHKNDQIIPDWEQFNPKSNLSQQKNVKQTNQSDIESNKIGSGGANGERSPPTDELDPPPQVAETSLFDSIPLEKDILEDNKLWTKGIQESGLWEWDDLVMADNMNLGDLGNFF
ncbi:hypothetical protein U1Q18_039452 [Sarracenia purpurea var. burkii]